MDIDVRCFYDDNYEIIDGTKVRFIKIEGPYAHMLPNRNTNNNDRNGVQGFLNKVKNNFKSKREA